jgi:hypothetical protein
MPGYPPAFWGETHFAAFLRFQVENCSYDIAHEGVIWLHQYPTLDNLLPLGLSSPPLDGVIISASQRGEEAVMWPKLLAGAYTVMGGW